MLRSSSTAFSSLDTGSRDSAAPDRKCSFPSWRQPRATRQCMHVTAVDPAARQLLAAAWTAGHATQMQWYDAQAARQRNALLMQHRTWTSASWRHRRTQHRRMCSATTRWASGLQGGKRTLVARALEPDAAAAEPQRVQPGRRQAHQLRRLGVHGVGGGPPARHHRHCSQPDCRTCHNLLD